MSTADLAVVAIAVVSLAHGHWHHRFRMRMVDRIRVVSPPKQDKAAAEPGAAVTKIAATREAS